MTTTTTTGKDGRVIYLPQYYFRHVPFGTLPKNVSYAFSWTGARYVVNEPYRHVVQSRLTKWLSGARGRDMVDCLRQQVQAMEALDHWRKRVVAPQRYFIYRFTRFYNASLRDVLSDDTLPEENQACLDAICHGTRSGGYWFKLKPEYIKQLHCGMRRFFELNYTSELFHRLRREAYVLAWIDRVATDPTAIVTPEMLRGFAEWSGVSVKYLVGNRQGRTDPAATAAEPTPSPEPEPEPEPIYNFFAECH